MPQRIVEVYSAAAFAAASLRAQTLTLDGWTVSLQGHDQLTITDHTALPTPTIRLAHDIYLLLAERP